MSASKEVEKTAPAAAEGTAAQSVPQVNGKSASIALPILNYRVGIIPLPVYVVLFGLVGGLSLAGKINGEISMMIGALTLGGFTCAEIGGRIPLLRNLGGAAVVTIFLPSFLASVHFFSKSFVENVTTFTNSTNFIYLYISAVVVGSILSMDRRAMISGFLKIFVPLLGGSVVALGLGAGAGWLAGLGMRRSLYFVVIPVMAGGVGEGAIPLSVGYAEILHQTQGQLLAQILPVAFLGNVAAILICGFLNNLGKQFPHLTGNGRLDPADSGKHGVGTEPKGGLRSDFTSADAGTVAAGGLLAITIYLIGVLIHAFAGLPAPVGMLVVAVLVKLLNVVPPDLEEGVRFVFRFFVVAVTYPLLFATAVALTPWADLVAALHPGKLLIIVVTVASLTVSGFFIGRVIGLHPIDTAIVNATHSGLGGTGDVMILTAAERMELMPFAQVATRIGGAIMVTAALIALARLGQ